MTLKMVHVAFVLHSLSYLTLSVQLLTSSCTDQALVDYSLVPHCSQSACKPSLSVCAGPPRQGSISEAQPLRLPANLPVLIVCMCVQAQHGRAGSWGSSGSASDLPTLAPSGGPSNVGPPSASASGQLPEGVPASRLLATIHSGIPSTDDDGMSDLQ